MLYPKLKSYIEQAFNRTNQLDNERKKILSGVVDYLGEYTPAKLNFICTHNSRRSHLAQIWAQTAAYYFQVQVETFSGGTEATAFNENAVSALKEAGFEIHNPGGDNPRYEVSFDSDLTPMICYSKKFDESPNPEKGFAAIMTCSEADAECPVVFGADQRIKLFYEDPKIADGTPKEKETYQERCLQIATEMLYVFSKITES